MIIEKTAQTTGAFRRSHFLYPTARAAFRAFLAAADLRPGQKVLLPAFIGWSPREGSGVFDPVRELGVQAEFYQVDDRLDLDVTDFEAKLAAGDVRVAVLIHYFGYVDPSFKRAAALARGAGALILEDEAHALFTDMVGGACGRLGDACIYSLHKMLPNATGGMLVHNRDDLPSPADAVIPADAFAPWDYDLLAIARRRRANASLLGELLAVAAIPGVEPLWPGLGEGIVPQTYPILVRGVSRFALYQRMNEAGYGVVALYHTLIDQLPRETYPAAHRLADTIMNLPVHQDVGEPALRAMVEELGRQVLALREAAPASS